MPSVASQGGGAPYPSSFGGAGAHRRLGSRWRNAHAAGPAGGLWPAHEPGSDLDWDDDDAYQFAKVIRSGALLSVQSIYLTRNTRISRAGRVALMEAIATGSAPCLAHCWLTDTDDLVREAKGLRAC